MRRFLAATVVAGGLCVVLAYAILTTLRAEATGPLGVSGANLLDIGSLQLRLALVSAGGTVATILPDGVIVQDRKQHLLHIYFGPHAIFDEHGTAVDRAAIEVGSHITALGLRGSNGFSAYKVHISPHHHAIGGLIVQKLGGNLYTVVNHHAIMSLVRVLPSAAITLRGRPTHIQLRPNVHIVAFAVRDPQQTGLYLADAVHVLQPRQTFRGGGLITRVDPGRNIITIYNKTLNLQYTIEVTPATKIKLSKWAAGYGDMRLGDHLTVSGVTDPVNSAIGPNPIVAKVIRISPLNFGGVITAIQPAPLGGRVLTVRARRGHMLQIDAPGRAAVAYGTPAQPAHVLDLLVGERISARGSRVGKFELVATSIHVYPRQRTVGGTVAAILPGLYRITNPADGSQFIIRLTPRTIYTLNGKAATAAAVAVGTHIRVHGYDALHENQKSIPTLVATHVNVTVHRAHPPSHRTTKRKSPGVKKNPQRIVPQPVAPAASAGARISSAA